VFFFINYSEPLAVIRQPEQKDILVGKNIKRDAA
jgi:hypothetical protein